MKNYLIAERYAQGLSGTIKDNADVEAALAAMKSVTQLYETSHDLRSCLSNPAIDRDVRAKVLAGVLAKEGAPTLVARLVQLLLKRGRISFISDVTQVFSAIADDRLNRIGATVLTAVALSNTQETALNQALANFSKKSVRMTCNVEPDILGGVLARVGGTAIDGSVRTQLETLRQMLLSEEK